MKLYPIVILLILTSCIEHMQDKPARLIEAPSAIGSEDDPYARHEFEMMQIIDPKTGTLPVSIQRKQLNFTKKSQVGVNAQFKKNTLDWTLTGPGNVGGRTRALEIDVTNENVLIAGGVSGGMWKSEDGGRGWNRTSHPATLNNSTCIVQDISSGQENIWYHGTGELRGNSARIGDTPYRGDGIFKSLDGGESWDILPSTSFEKYEIFDSPFNYVWNLKISPNDDGPGDLYAAIYGGIVRSLDGGATWTTVLGDDLINSDLEDINDSQASFYTNILILPTGDMFATLSTQTGMGDTLVNKGVHKSSDGINWVNITPGGFPMNHDRIVMDYSPSDVNTIYFWIANNDENFIWKNINGTWVNHSYALDSEDSELADLDTQSSYNMTLKVHPENSNIVYYGGTNLFRSSDGFLTATGIDHIGGYDPEESNDLYSGHHPDFHDILFYPSDPNKMLTASDGGIHLTLNNQADEVTWEARNNGYITSQFYSVAISKSKFSHQILGGMQDNGSYLRSIGGEAVPWNRILGGDGSFCATTKGEAFWYVSFQNGNVFRVSLDSYYEMIAFAQVDPSGGSGYLFINPFVLDPNNHNRMYLAGGTVVWRNDNLTQIAGGRQKPTPINWTKIESTKKANHTVSALDISTSPAHTLYYGSRSGLISRVANANAIDASTDSLFYQPGYVSSIGIDPSNADHFMFTYGNYNILSIFASFDGGQTIQQMGGNLEESENGEGNGPSVRWCEIVPLVGGGYKYFVGTSAGLFSTTELLGASTVWVQEGVNSLGNSVVRMMDYRSNDGRIVVATHGNGVFESTVSNALEVEPVIDDVESIVIHPGYPNPFTDRINIELTIPEDDYVTIWIVNSSGKRIKLLLHAPQFAGQVLVEWDGTNSTGDSMPNGMYFYYVEYRGQKKAGKMVLVR
ncbi:MAG: T9SS type A sorting domain-containing protein [Reichenbachiella sp.]